MRSAISYEKPMHDSDERMNIVVARTSVPICSHCRRSSIEQFSRSQRKRWRQNKPAVCTQCQQMGPPKETKTSGRERQFTPDAMCVCVPQPYASLIVSGFYRCIPTRSAELKGYRGTLWIASKEKHSRTDVLTDHLAEWRLPPPVDWPGSVLAGFV